MNSKIIIITILILVKVVGVVSHARAEGLACSDGTKYSYMTPITCIYKYGAFTKYEEFLLDPNNPKYRCGKALTNKEKIK
jgi:hypothetical protein